MNRVEDLLVPGAAAEISGQRLADLVVARVGDAPQQIRRGDHETGRAEPALDGSRVGERLLDPMQLSARAEPLDRHDRVTVRLCGENEARADERTVEKHR